MKNKIEFRIRDTKVESDGDMIVTGYVNKTEQYSEELGIVKRFKEKIAKGSFKRAIERALGDIDFLADHNPDLVLASTKNGTLKLEEDDIGLKMEARIMNTSTGRDWYEMIASGLITNMSFGFSVVEDTWNKIDDNLYERHISDLDLYEVSAVRTPAYAQSTIASRGLNMADEEIIPSDISEEDTMDKETLNTLLDTMEMLAHEVRALREERGTKGVDKDGNEVGVQKDNYAVGQLTKDQAEFEDDFKIIKADEDVGKYANDMEIDDKGSYNHDTKVKGVDENGVQTNQPESEIDEKIKKYDGSDPDEVPGVQGGESEVVGEPEVEPEVPEEPEVEPEEPEVEPASVDKSQERSANSKSYSFESFETRMRELRERLSK